MFDGVQHIGAAESWARLDALQQPASARPETVARPESEDGDSAIDISRLFDIVASLLAIAFIAPLLLIVALLVWAQDRGPSVYSQMRIGRGGKPFKCLKFRSMVMDADARLRRLLESDEKAAAAWARDHKLKADPRITPLGQFLRTSSIDELPQLFNVLRGDMSLVGPRPIVEAEIQRYGRFFSRYCSVRPGITGLWQVSGRNDTTYGQRVVLDVAYTRYRCFALNVAILVRTIPAVLVRNGSY